MVETEHKRKTDRPLNKYQIFVHKVSQKHKGEYDRKQLLQAASVEWKRLGLKK